MVRGVRSIIRRVGGVYHSRTDDQKGTQTRKRREVVCNLDFPLYLPHRRDSWHQYYTRDRLRMPRLSVMPYTDRSILAEEVSDDHSREKEREGARADVAGGTAGRVADG